MTLQNIKIQLRSDVLANWTSLNPILKENELIIVNDTDNNIERFKIGNGISSFNQLPYVNEQKIITDILDAGQVKAQSITQGSNISASQLAFAAGIFLSATANFSQTLGINAHAKQNDDYSFVWNGDSTGTLGEFYETHGQGTFNINPVNGISGFYIGDQTLSGILSSTCQPKGNYLSSNALDSYRTYADTKSSLSSDGYVTQAHLNTKSVVSVDNQRADVNILHISQEEYNQLVVDDATLSNTVYVLSSDYVEAYGQQIKNIAAGTDLSDAVNVEQLSNAVSSLDAENVWEACDAVDSAKRKITVTTPVVAGSENTVISQGALATGVACVAGLKGYRYTNTGVVTSSLTFDTVPTGWAAGDVVSIVNDHKYANCATIASISGTTITFTENLPFSSIIADTGWDAKIVYVLTKPDVGNVEIGYGAYAEGLGTKALNVATHAEGSDTTAYGQYSHTEGRGTKAGYAAHAEGKNTEANGEYSHAEGGLTKATGLYSHAEGKSTEANGDYSHTEGNTTTASGQQSHSEGLNTLASGQNSHSEGKLTTASGTSSHAEGSGVSNKRLIAEGAFSHAEGACTYAKGDASHAEGYGTVSEGGNSHAEGGNTKAQNNNEHAEGKYNLSHKATNSWGDGGNTLHSIGIGTSNSNRKNAVEVMQNGDVYIKGIGNYDGTSISSAQSTQEWINSQISASLTSSDISAAYTNQHIYLSAKGQIVGNIDCSDFIKDGMLSSAELCGTVLVMKFNTDTDLVPISVQLSNFVDNYDEKITGLSAAIDGKVYVDSLSAQSLSVTHIGCDDFYQRVQTSSLLSNEIYVVSCDYVNTYGQQIKNVAEPTELSDAATKGYVDNAVQGVQIPTDLSAFANSPGYLVSNDISGYYQKSETSSAAELSDAFSAKADISSSLIFVEWADLTALADAEELVPGQKYRITDYVTTVDQDDCRSAGHPFDLIVTAIDRNTLDEHAVATLPSNGDDYFDARPFHVQEYQQYLEYARVPLESWDIKYCLDNDKTRFKFADTENGKGVIYYMKDEFGNEAPYDFKNVQFKRYLITSSPGATGLEGMYGLAVGNIEADKSDEMWCYTFNGADYADLGFSEPYDFSGWHVRPTQAVLQQFGGPSIERLQECTRNVIQARQDDSNDFSLMSFKLPNNVFHCVLDQTPVSELPFIKIGLCSTNKLGSFCYSNTFGNNCNRNIFGDNCNSNIFGNYCYSNTFGNSFYNNTFGNDCSGNTFGINCNYNTFGNDCGSNTFGNDCYNNTFGNSCYNNTFGNDCYYIIFASTATSNPSQAKSYYKYINIDSGNQYIILNCTQTTYDGNEYKNVRILPGVNNTSSYKTITDNNVNQNFCTTYQPANSQVIAI